LYITHIVETLTVLLIHFCKSLWIKAAAKIPIDFINYMSISGLKNTLF